MEPRIRFAARAVLIDDRGRTLLFRAQMPGFPDGSRVFWITPGGGIEPGEDALAAVRREVFEETGLNVRVKRLVGVYSHPDQLVIYADGGKFQIVALHFETEVIGGTLGLSDETSDFGYFSMEEVEGLEMLGRHKERILDTLAACAEAFIK